MNRNPIKTRALKYIAQHHNPGRGWRSKSLCLVMALALSSTAIKANEPFTQLKPSVSIKPGKVSGKGAKREAVMEIKNNGKKSIKKLVVYVSYIKADGTDGKVVPHTQDGFYGLRNNLLKKGKVYKNKVSSFFMQDDTVKVDGTVTEIIFKDGSKWPEVPAERLARPGKDPVYAVMLGVIGEGDRTRPAYTCYNYDLRAVKSVSVHIDYIGADGKKISSTSYGHSKVKSLIGPERAAVVSGGKRPPQGAVAARIKITRVVFSDGSEWAPPKG